MLRRLFLTLLFCLTVSIALAADPAFVYVRPLRNLPGLYNDPLNHATTDLDGPHENTHQVNSQIRNYFSRNGQRYNAVYVLRDRACVILEPPFSLHLVAQSVPSNYRGPNFDLYLGSQLRDWGDRPLYLLDEWSSYISGLECDLSTSRPNNSPDWEYRCAVEFFWYAQVLLQVTRQYAPNYDARQLEAVIQYQHKRLQALRPYVRGY